MNYLQMDIKGKISSEEKLLADYFGEGNYVPFYRKHLIQRRIHLTHNDFVSGDIPTMMAAMKALNISYSHDDYPVQLKEFLHRDMYESTLGRMQQRVFNEELTKDVFIKPKDKIKKFTGFVLHSYDDWLLTEGAGLSTKIMCSEVVKFVSEFRVAVVNGKATFYAYYSGDQSKEPDHSVVDAMICSWWNSPKAYCLDVGVLDTGETALIEINDAFSCGSYTMPKEIYANLLITRWNELKESTRQVV